MIRRREGTVGASSCRMPMKSLLSAQTEFSVSLHGFSRYREFECLLCRNSGGTADVFALNSNVQGVFISYRIPKRRR